MPEFDSTIIYGDLDVKRTTKTLNFNIENTTTTKDLTVSNNATVTNTTTTKDLTVSNNATVTNTTTTKDLTVSNNANITNTTTTKDLTVSNNANITNTTTTKDLTVSNGMTVTNTTTTKDLTVSNKITTKDASVTNTLDVRNGITANDITIDGMGKSLKTILGTDGNAIQNSRVAVEMSKPIFMLGNHDWSSLLIAGSGTYVSGANGGMQFTNSQDVLIRTRIPVDPSATYIARVRVRKVSGTGTFYGGAHSLDGSFNYITTDAVHSYNYFIATNVSIAAGATSIFEGYISGYNPASPTAGSHNKFDPNAGYFDIILLPNYSGTGDTVIESIEIFKTYDWLPISGTLNMNTFAAGRIVLPVGANKWAT